MRGRAGSVPGILVFPTEANRDLGNREAGWKSRHMNTTYRLRYRDEWRDEFWRSGWHRLALPAVFSTS